MFVPKNDFLCFLFICSMYIHSSLSVLLLLRRPSTAMMSRQQETMHRARRMQARPCHQQRHGQDEDEDDEGQEHEHDADNIAAMGMA